MASWEDGAEYAPIERPFGFATPRVAPLEDPQPEPNPSLGAPVKTPTTFTSPVQHQPPLESLVPTTQAPRDPHQPFQTHSSSTPTGSTWSPDQPIQVQTGSLLGSAWGSARMPATTATLPPPPPGSVPVNPMDFPPPNQLPDRSSAPQFPPPRPGTQSGPNFPPPPMPRRGPGA